MKNHLSLSVFVLFACFVYAQEATVFKVRVRPNTTYTSEMTLYNLTEMENTTGQALETALKNSTTLIESTTKVTGIMEAKSRKGNGNIPIEIRYTDAASSTLINGKEQKMDLPITGSIIQAQYTPDDRYVLDSITGEALNPQFKQLITTMLEQMQQQVDFPETPLKIGDSFSTEKPMDITSTGMGSIKSSIATTYVLEEIKAGTAVFSFDQQLSMEIKQEGGSLEAKGEGSGSCEYDIPGQYLSYYKTELHLEETANITENVSRIVNSTTISEIKMKAE